VDKSSPPHPSSLEASTHDNAEASRATDKVEEAIPPRVIPQFMRRRLRSDEAELSDSVSDRTSDDDSTENKIHNKSWLRTLATSKFAFEVTRFLLVITIFVFLHGLMDRHILTPWLRPEDEDAWKRTVIEKICPEGGKCEFDLKPEWRKFKS